MKKCNKKCSTHENKRCISNHKKGCWSENEHLHSGWSIVGNKDCKWN